MIKKGIFRYKVMPDVLAGFYTNERLNSVYYSECAVKVDSENDPTGSVYGTYNTVWFENTVETISAILVVTLEGHRLKFEWSNPATKTHFEGYAQQEHHMIYGHYYSV